MARISAGRNKPIIMSPVTKLEINDRQVKLLAKRFPRKAPRMISRAANKTGTFARKEMVKRLGREVVNVKAGDLKRKNVILKKGSTKNPGATVTITGSRIPLIQFKGTSQTKTGVGYRIEPGGSREKIREAFITPFAHSASGHTREGVFARSTKRRLPIHELFGPSVPHALEEHPQVFKGVIAHAQQRFEKEIASQIEYEISKD